MGNYTSCPYPPGGGVNCDDHQIAYCIIENSAVSGGCYSSDDNDKPADVQIKKFVGWIASEVTKDYSRELLREIEKIIKHRKYKSDDGNFEMHFKLPSRKAS